MPLSAGALLADPVRWAFREERLPAVALWLLAADGVATWLRWFERGFGDELGDRGRAREVLARAAAPAFERRYAQLRARFPSLPDPRREPRALPLVMSGLYRVPRFAKIAWLFDPLGGAARSPRDQLRAWWWVRPIGWRERWEEVSTHLGEVLVALTQNLGREDVPRANRLMGRLCFEAGARYGRTMQRRFALPSTPASAIEVLRMGEYIFRVNPDHTSAADAQSGVGFIEGTACPWHVRPGWSGMHCGIFGQFQSGVSSVFGLRYRLTSTIPNHGGHLCRIDLVPRVSPRT